MNYTDNQVGTGKFRISIEVSYFADFEEITIDEVSDFGYPVSNIESLSDLARETLQSEFETLDIEEWEFSSWGCRVDERNPRFKQWEASEHEFMTHGLTVFEKDFEGEDFESFWPGFIKLLENMNLEANQYGGHFVISCIRDTLNLQSVKFGERVTEIPRSLFPSRPEILELISEIQKGSECSKLGTFSQILLRPAAELKDVDDVECVYGELLVSLPKLKSPEFGYVKDLLTNANSSLIFEQKQLGLENVSWLTTTFTDNYSES